MTLFEETQFFRADGIKDAKKLALGPRFYQKCFLVEFSDKTSLVLPEYTKIQLEKEKVFEIKENPAPIYLGTKPKHLVKFFCPNFYADPPDPYLMGIVVISRKFRDKLTIREKLDIDKVPREFYKFSVRTKYQRIVLDFNLRDHERKFFSMISSISPEMRSIPDEYLYANHENRRLLLNAILDIKAFCIPGGIALETRSYQLAQDIAFLVKSFEGSFFIHPMRKQFRICMSFKKEFNPFLLRHPIEDKNYPAKRFIKKCSPMGSLPCVKILSDNVITQNFIRIQS